MRKTILCLAFIFYMPCVTLLAQVRAQDSLKCSASLDTILNREVYTIAEKQPEFPGGSEGLMHFLIKNIKYPSHSEYQGSIYLTFIVEPDGSLSDKRIYHKATSNTRPTPPEQAALDVLDIMPDWEPGKCDGKAVPVRMYLPIRFSSK